MLEASPQALVQKIVYFVSNLLGIALALYKCSSMGLLPTHSSDWLSFLEPQQVRPFNPNPGGTTNILLHLDRFTLKQPIKDDLKYIDITVF